MTNETPAEPAWERAAEEFRLAIGEYVGGAGAAAAMDAMLHNLCVAVRAEEQRRAERVEQERWEAGYETARNELGVAPDEHYSDALARREREAYERGVAWALGLDVPWPVLSCLSRLADAAGHLLYGHDCDAHGWEEVRGAMLAARKHVARIEAGEREGDGRE